MSPMKSSENQSQIQSTESDIKPLGEAICFPQIKLRVEFSFHTTMSAEEDIHYKHLKNLETKLFLGGLTTEKVTLSTTAVP